MEKNEFTCYLTLIVTKMSTRLSPRCYTGSLINFRNVNKNNPDIIYMSRLRSVKCRRCGIRRTNLKKCPGCKKVYYCNLICQFYDWIAHKETCERSNDPFNNVKIDS